MQTKRGNVTLFPENCGKTQTKRGNVTVTVTAPTLLAACGIAASASRSQSRTHAYLFWVLPTDFEEKRDCSQSSSLAVTEDAIQFYS